MTVQNKQTKITMTIMSTIIIIFITKRYDNELSILRKKKNVIKHVIS